MQNFSFDDRNGGACIQKTLKMFTLDIYVEIYSHPGRPRCVVDIFFDILFVREDFLDSHEALAARGSMPAAAYALEVSISAATTPRLSSDRTGIVTLAAVGTASPIRAKLVIAMSRLAPLRRFRVKSSMLRSHYF